MYENNLNSTPLISIAMATYNGEKYLKEQLDSIYAQTYKNIEVIVTDDCSTDKTVEILEEYVKSHELKYYINEKNLGFVKNFEKAVSLCQGEYIALSDQDDIWFPNKLVELLEHIEEYSLICSDAILVDNNRNEIKPSLLKLTHKNVFTGNAIHTLFFSKFAYGCTILMKKGLIEKSHPIPDGVSFHDWWYASVASVNQGICYYDKPLIAYRQHNENVSIAGKRQSAWYKVFRLFNKNFSDQRLKGAIKKKNELIAIERKGLLSKEEKYIVDELLNYYSGRIDGVNRFCAVKIALKYRDELFFNLPKVMRIPVSIISVFI